MSSEVEVKKKFKQVVLKHINEKFAEDELFCAPDLFDVAKAEGRSTTNIHYVFAQLVEDGEIVRTDKLRLIDRRRSVLYRRASLRDAYAPKSNSKEAHKEARTKVMMIAADRLCKALGVPCHA